MLAQLEIQKTIQKDEFMSEKRTCIPPTTWMIFHWPSPTSPERKMRGIGGTLHVCIFQSLRKNTRRQVSYFLGQ